MRDKKKLTETLVAQLPETHRLTFEQAMRTWWVNRRKSGGMRLTDEGYHAMSTLLDLANYEIEINPQTFNRQIMLMLDRKLLMPYYIRIEKRRHWSVIMFGSREAMLARLYGDIEPFLKNYSQ